MTQAFPLYTVIMLIVNKNHHLHKLPFIPLGRAVQGQHAAAQIQKKQDIAQHAPSQYWNKVTILQL